ncbi:MAG TPA: hypothetical protein VFI47_06580 [Acidimicrobiales bacterium]|nr:hypothetical protein [Acidimicrobiales bacterium]
MPRPDRAAAPAGTGADDQTAGWADRQDQPTADDPRWIVYARDDGYAEASTVVPDPSWPTGWLCPGCECNTIVFYGLGPQFNPVIHRYERPDTRLCRSCFKQAVAEAVTS